MQTQVEHVKREHISFDPQAVEISHDRYEDCSLAGHSYYKLDYTSRSHLYVG